jgi:hypothetical protein
VLGSGLPVALVEAVKALIAQGQEEDQVIVAVLYVVILASVGRSYPRATRRRMCSEVDRGLPRQEVNRLYALAKTCLPATP